MQLEFNVNEQIITHTNPEKKVVANSQNYLYAKFTFSEDWLGVKKTALFKKVDIYSKATGKAYKMLLENDMCRVPHEVIENPAFQVSVFGGDRITANRAEIVVIKSGYEEGTTPEEPTPDIYTQILGVSKHAEEVANSVREDADNGEFNGADGRDGTNGVDGKDGYTPVKGADYWTEEDKTEIVKDVLKAMPSAEGVDF